MVLEGSGTVPECDYLISYRYRTILKKEDLKKVRKMALNIHTSLLPWNRGADPNFWSWFDGTPKGVTVHGIDEGVDTGPIISQAKVRWLHPERETLESTYDELQRHALLLFSGVWARIERGEHVQGARAKERGSYHSLAQFKDWQPRLPKGWQTPVLEVEAMGQQVRNDHEQRTTDHAR